VVAYKSLKTKKKSSWVIPKVVAVAYGNGLLQELFITKFKSQFKWVFAKVVVTRAGRLQGWLQGELRLYFFFGVLTDGTAMFPCRMLSMVTSSE